MEFEGKIALVTGAAQGIGAAVARELALRGTRVAAVDIHNDALRTLVIEAESAGIPGITPYVIDISESGAVDDGIARIEREMGAIDYLVNVAGVLRLKPVIELSDADWDWSLAVNTTGVFNVSRGVARRMVKRGHGAIVTVGSNATAVPRTGMAAYAASKAAAAHFTRCLGLELAAYGIRCNLVSPGSTDTAMQRLLWPGDEVPETILAGSLQDYRTGIPLRRIADPEDVADAVLFLLSEQARHITLHDLRVDGGATLGA